MRAIETLQDLIEEAKVRTVWWAICVLGFSYILSKTSNSIWINIPLSFLLLSVLRFITQEVEFHWKVKPVQRLSYLSHLRRNQISVDDPHLSSMPENLEWKRKIDSPIIEAAVNDLINKILKDFMTDLWYSEITPDKEAPEQIRMIIHEVLGEISGRVKALNLVDLLTRDIVDLIGNHIDLYRRNQTYIGIDVMARLSFEERDERLKEHLTMSKELHPALQSPESEYKVLQRLIGGVLAVALKPPEVECPLIRCLAREFLTCLVLQPVLNFASPGYINELIERLFLATEGDTSREVRDVNSTIVTSQDEHNIELNSRTTANSIQKEHRDNKTVGTSENQSQQLFRVDPQHFNQPGAADWARILEVATQRRSQVLAPENLENMWTKGRNYRKKIDSHSKTESLPLQSKTTLNDKALGTYNLNTKNLGSVETNVSEKWFDKSDTSNRNLLKRSNSTSSLKSNDNIKAYMSKSSQAISSKVVYGTNSCHQIEEPLSGSNHNEVSLRVPKIKCRVVGAYFEKLGSKAFAVYSIAVTDAENKTWFVKRRYRNFERLHRHLKDIPNYSLHLPPKRFLSSSIDDYFVHQRCISLDKYLQDLLSIPNVAEEHEFWDFLSLSSKNYSFGKSTSVIKTLAVNVDDAMDDIVRQFKGVSDGLLGRKVLGPSSISQSSTLLTERNMTLSWNEDSSSRQSLSYNGMEISHSLSDNEEGTKHEGHSELYSDELITGWHSDNELNSKGFPPRIIQRHDKVDSSRSDLEHDPEKKPDNLALDSLLSSDNIDDLIGVPPEWTPPNVSVPLLNLVDKVFQLNRRGWLRRQVLWISKQILQLMMEDAIDDWLLRQIRWLRRDVVVAYGIRWVQDVLWPNGVFFLKLGNDQSKMDDKSFNLDQIGCSSNVNKEKVPKPGSFEHQLEAARRASDVKKMILDGAPATLVSLIGYKQYRRTAKDIYFFLQSNICVKQLAYGILELLLVSVFPELNDVILEINENTPLQPAKAS